MPIKTGYSPHPLCVTHSMALTEILQVHAKQGTLASRMISDFPASTKLKDMTQQEQLAEERNGNYILS